MIFSSTSGSMLRRSMTQKLIACGLVLLLMAPLERVAVAQQPQQSKTGSSSLPQSPQPSTEQNTSAAQQQDQQPATPSPAVGTAAAPYEKTTGITGTRPAGAVIAPAKQRRIRSILIKVGIVAGAGAAVAVVALLSHSSPSQPH
jgi:hypothetical protein